MESDERILKMKNTGKSGKDKQMNEMEKMEEIRELLEERISKDDIRQIVREELKNSGICTETERIDRSVRLITFHLKKKWFDLIKSGEKCHEYREVKPYWNTRIRNWTGLYTQNLAYKVGFTNNCYIIFQCGYFGEKLLAQAEDIEIVDGKYTDLRISKPVYSIRFELVNL